MLILIVTVGNLSANRISYSVKVDFNIQCVVYRLHHTGRAERRSGNTVHIFAYNRFFIESYKLRNKSLSLYLSSDSGSFRHRQERHSAYFSVSINTDHKLNISAVSASDRINTATDYLAVFEYDKDILAAFISMFSHLISVGEYAENRFILCFYGVFRNDILCQHIYNGKKKCNPRTNRRKNYYHSYRVFRAALFRRSFLFFYCFFFCRFCGFFFGLRFRR